jgi:CheY-like chemotaxis protein
MPDMPTTDEFLASLRHALRHLYDANTLRHSPLIEVLGLSACADPVVALRQTLTKAIRALEPEADTPADSHMWRAYETLLYRCVQRCSQLEAADQLGISERHLRREERTAAEVLAYRLKCQFGLKFVDSEDAHQTLLPSQNAQRSAAINDEVAHLEHASSKEPTDLREILPTLLELVRPICLRYKVQIEIRDDLAVGPLVVQQVALRQILLSLLNVAIHWAVNSRIDVRTQALKGQAEITLRAASAGGNAEPTAEDVASLEVAKRLVKACGGQVTLEYTSAAFAATLLLPTVEPLPILVIEDNPQTLRLFQRYVSGTRYTIVGAQNLPEAFGLAEQTPPQAIILDVMMPDMDGWEMLGHLKQHPATANIPIVVCTVVAAEELALSLGAARFMRKPISRQSFLGVIDRLAGLKDSEPQRLPQ